jgi:hypothetical protein
VQSHWVRECQLPSHPLPGSKGRSVWVWQVRPRGVDTFPNDAFPIYELWNSLPPGLHELADVSDLFVAERILIG